MSNPSKFYTPEGKAIGPNDPMYCDECGQLGTYVKEYDARHCCGEWLTDCCDGNEGPNGWIVGGGGKCHFCDNRPMYPPDDFIDIGKENE